MLPHSKQTCVHTPPTPLPGAQGSEVAPSSQTDPSVFTDPEAMRPRAGLISNQFRILQTFLVQSSAGPSLILTGPGLTLATTLTTSS